MIFFETHDFFPFPFSSNPSKNSQNLAVGGARQAVTAHVPAASNRLRRWAGRRLIALMLAELTRTTALAGLGLAAVALLHDAPALAQSKGGDGGGSHNTSGGAGGGLGKDGNPGSTGTGTDGGGGGGGGPGGGKGGKGGDGANNPHSGGNNEQNGKDATAASAGGGGGGGGDGGDHGLVQTSPSIDADHSGKDGGKGGMGAGHQVRMAIPAMAAAVVAAEQAAMACY
ncbi:hypothetical protein ATN84_16340 [Paramesorhizobium deserti]|uniref:Uncharacterized protein n=1 Tax=Paramesorhizobium deserti TaxID=1494590 RepID=A0A135HQU6_9HYPH|nr:hypothetical protein ATN84_16340 [Paramesorhizobium deserti]